MSDFSVQILNILFAIGSLPPTFLLLFIFFREIQAKPLYLRATLSALIFLFFTFFITSIGTTIISFFYILGLQSEAQHYSILKTLLTDATWFTVTWALYLVHSRKKVS